MVHNQPIASSVSSELSASLHQTLTSRRTYNLGQVASLPGSFSSFMLLILAMALVSGGMALLIAQSVQIFQIRQQINAVQVTFRTVERQNAELVWAAAQYTSLNRVRARALALGYEPPTERHYVVQATPATTGAGESLGDSAAPANATLSSSEVADATRSPFSLAGQFQQFINQARQSWWP